jgi:hypothetical protein
VKVYVETNFVLELALQQAQHAECEEFVRLAESKSVIIALPAFSLVESADALKRKHHARELLSDKLNIEIQQLRRSSAFTQEADAAHSSFQAFLVQTAHHEDSRLRSLYTRLLNAADVLSLSAQVLSRVEDFPDLELGDAIVLTSVLSDLGVGSEPTCFLNRDRKGFDDPAIHTELGRRQCKLIGSFVDGLRYVKSQISEGGG